MSVEGLSNVGRVKVDMTIDELIKEILNGRFANDDNVKQFVLNVDNAGFDRFVRGGHVQSMLREELGYMTEWDFEKLVDTMDLGINLVG